MLSSTSPGATAVGALADVASQVVLQAGRGFEQPQVAPEQQALGTFVLTVIVGAVLLVAAPGYVDRVVDRIGDEPAASFVWGVVVLVGFVAVAVVLVLTIVLAILVIPLLLVFLVVAIVGNVLGYVAIFGRFVDGRWESLLLGALVAGATNYLPTLGGLVGFVVGAIGLGAVVADWRS